MVVAAFGGANDGKGVGEIDALGDGDTDGDGDGDGSVGLN
jgi:hypothetical protein